MSRLQCLHNRRLLLLCYLEKMEESSWHFKYQKFQIDVILAKGQSRKTWNDVIREDLEKWDVSRELTNNRNT